MDGATRTSFEQMQSADRMTSYAAFMAVLAASEQPVDWAYEVWDALKRKLTDRDPHERARAAQILARLAQSDPRRRMLKDFDAVFAVTHDEKFVTARHALQSAWRVGTAGPKQRQLVVRRLAERFEDAAADKNTPLVRYDVIVALRSLYDAVKDETIRTTALRLIETETDLKYRKKYAGVWKRA